MSELNLELKKKKRKVHIVIRFWFESFFSSKKKKSIDRGFRRK